MRRIVIFAVLMIFGSASAVLYADDDSRKKSNHFSAKLSGYNEVHFSGGALRGAVSTKATGTFRAKVRKDMDVIDYELSYKGLEGTVTQAHIHFGQRHTVGGIVVWLCDTETNPAPTTSTPACPAEGTVTGTITPGDVLALLDQGFVAGEFGELVRALEAGTAYANVHSTAFGPGEIRGQIRDVHKRRDKDRDHDHDKDHDKGDHRH